MRYFILFTSLSLLLICCEQPNPSTTPLESEAHIYPTTSYLDIELDSNGGLPTNPYVLEFSNGKKTVVFCGVNHLTDNSDIENPMFAKIEQRFVDFQPEIAINEGGDVSKKIYASKREALLQDGEIGLVKILSDSLKIKTVNGDPTEKYEFAELLKKYSKGELIAYIVTERLMWGLKGQGIEDSLEVERQYNGFIQEYMMQEGGVSLSVAEQSFGFYKSNYEKLLNRPFELSSLEPTNPFEATTKFQAIGRYSKEVRDQFLLKTIDQLLDTHDRIVIVFGGWHLLTCKPGLEEIIRKKRD